ncbi:MAG: nucleotide pyrophosphohydrolase [Saprospiraceae bacterium]|nr:nucleotide pyrophosphohydrolase [Saprospiraceae bacterium]
MTLTEWQKEVDDWISTYGVRYFDEKTNSLLLAEEVGEFCKLIARKYGEQSFKNTEDKNSVDQEIGDEIGDVFFVLTCLANQMGYNLNSILEKNMSKKTKRDKVRHHKNEKLS